MISVRFISVVALQIERCMRDVELNDSSCLARAIRRREVDAQMLCFPIVIRSVFITDVQRGMFQLFDIQYVRSDARCDTA
jgi:hypothetical protein